MRWYGAGDVRLDDVRVRRPEAGEVTVAVAYCGVCGSDLHEIDSGPHSIPVDRPHPLSGERAPITLGHEFSGTVVERGAGVRHLREGDPVAVEPNYRCRRCASCRSGRYETCVHSGFAGLAGHGGLAGYATVPGYMLHPLPHGFDLAAAAVLEPAAVALHAVRRGGFRPGQVALVVGLGPVGLLVCAMLALRGAGAVVGVDPVQGRRELAARIGATSVRAPEDGVGALVRELTSGEGADIAFEVVGTQHSLDTAMSHVRSNGEVVLLGLAPELTVRTFDMVNAQLTLRASVGYRDCHQELVELVADGRLDLTALITSVIALDAAPAMLLRAGSEGPTGIKTLVRCDTEAGSGAESGSPSG